MGLLKELDNQVIISSIDCLDWADVLRAAVVQATNSRPGWSRHQWAKQFHILKRQVDDSERIGRVLAWYAANLGKPYVPHAFSAESFRKNFLRIEQAMVRQQGEVVELDADALRVKRELDRWDWGCGRIDDLPRVLRHSQEGHRELLTRVIDAMAKQGHSGTTRYVLQGLRQRLSRFTSFYPAWSRLKLNRLAEWADWSGALSSLQFDANHRDVTIWITQLAKQHAGNDRAVAQVKALLGIA